MAGFNAKTRSRMAVILKSEKLQQRLQLKMFLPVKKREVLYPCLEVKQKLLLNLKMLEKKELNEAETKTISVKMNTEDLKIAIGLISIFMARKDLLKTWSSDPAEHKKIKELLKKLNRQLPTGKINEE